MVLKRAMTYNEQNISGNQSLDETARSSEKALACARTSVDKKGENVKVLDLTELSGFTDYFVITSGTSDRHVRAIADAIQSTFEASGKEIISIEGYADGRWILMDLGDVIVHIFLDALRDYYDLEGLWVDAPRVRIPSEFYGSAAVRLN